MSDLNKKRNDLLNKAMKEVQPYTTLITSDHQYPSKANSGSGTFVIMHERMGILTNWHVVKDLGLENDCRVVVPALKNSKKIAFDCIIKMPPIDEYYPDLAFIQFKKASFNELDQLMQECDKKFFNIDDAKLLYDKGMLHNKLDNSIWLIYGFVAEGRRYRKDADMMEYKKAGPYVVYPELEYDCIKFDSGVEIDLINCPINCEPNEEAKLPKLFAGMSGAALWSIVLNEDCSLHNIDLVGVATIQKSRNLICQGPIALYKSFYSFVKKWKD